MILALRHDASDWGRVCVVGGGGGGRLEAGGEEAFVLQVPFVEGLRAKGGRIRVLKGVGGRAQGHGDVGSAVTAP